jgi:hypothetical protein
LPKRTKSGPLAIPNFLGLEDKLLTAARERVRPYFIAAMAFAWSAMLAFAASAQVFSATAVKAAFLHRFASYVEWPAEAMGDGPFVIAVAGADEVAANLDRLLPGLAVQGRPAQVRRVTRAEELDGVHILYLGPDSAARTPELRAAAANRPILLVTDGENDFAGGGIINFVQSGTRVRFEVSLAAAERARLRIDSALLPVASRVERAPQAWFDSHPPRRLAVANGWGAAFLVRRTVS